MADYEPIEEYVAQAIWIAHGQTGVSSSWLKTARAAIDAYNDWFRRASYRPGDDLPGGDEHDPPSQSHSDTSKESSRAMSRRRVMNQERWVYETIRRGALADWELWLLAEPTPFFDKETSLHRARIGLKWRDKHSGATPWHPLEDSGQWNRNPKSNKRTIIWRIKERFAAMPYDQWAREYRDLAKGKREPKDDDA